MFPGFRAHGIHLSPPSNEGVIRTTSSIHFFLVALKPNARDAQADHGESRQGLPMANGGLVRSRAHDS
jgi:hypothetical protein